MATDEKTIKSYFTSAGSNLATRIQAGETKITFTKAVASDADHFSDSEATINQLTALDSVMQTADIGAVLILNKNTVQVSIDFNQNEITEDYQLRTIGLYAKPDDGDEILYSVTPLQYPQYMYADTSGSTLTINLDTAVGQSANVTVVVSPAGSVTSAQLTAQLQSYYTGEQVDKKIAAIPKPDLTPYAKTDADNTFTKANKFTTDPVNANGDAYISGKQVNDLLPDDIARTGADNAFTGANDFHTATVKGVNVATTADVNAVDAKSLARNLVANSGYMVNLDKWNGDNGGSLVLSSHSFYHNGTGNVIKLVNTQTGEAFAKSDWFKVKTNTQYTFQFILFGTANTSSTDVWLIGSGTNSKNIIGGYVQSPIQAELITKTFTTGNFEDAYIRIDNNGTNDGNSCYIAFTEVQLEDGSVAHPWTPPYSDVLHRVADNGDGSIRVNGVNVTPLNAVDTSIAATVDLDTIVTTGRYSIQANTNWSALHRPSQNWGSLRVDKHDTFIEQTFTADTDGQTYTRQNNLGTWSAWKQVISSTDTANWQKKKITADDGAVALSVTTVMNQSLADYLNAQPVGFYTIYVQAGVPGNPVPDRPLRGTVYIADKAGKGHWLAELTSSTARHFTLYQDDAVMQTNELISMTTLTTILKDYIKVDPNTGFVNKKVNFHYGDAMIEGHTLGWTDWVYDKATAEAQTAIYPANLYLVGDNPATTGGAS